MKIKVRYIRIIEPSIKNQSLSIDLKLFNKSRSLEVMTLEIFSPFSMDEKLGFPTTPFSDIILMV